MKMNAVLVGTSPNVVVLVWMQEESDGKNNRGDVCEDNDDE